MLQERIALKTCIFRKHRFLDTSDKGGMKGGSTRHSHASATWHPDSFPPLEVGFPESVDSGEDEWRWPPDQDTEGRASPVCVVVITSTSRTANAHHDSWLCFLGSVACGLARTEAWDLAAAVHVTWEGPERAGR